MRLQNCKRGIVATDIRLRSPVPSPGAIVIVLEIEAQKDHWREGWSSLSGGPEAMGATGSGGEHETHWNFCGDWSTNEWHFCHSTSGRRGSGGVLIGVRQELAAAQHIWWHEADPGRLLQVRCFLGTQQLDITDSRRKRLTKLDHLLGSLPARSQIILGGDFNSSMVTESRGSGYGLLQRELNEREKLDRDQLMRILQRHRLTALNTWVKKNNAGR